MAETPSLEQFTAQAKPLNPTYSDAQIADQYNKLYPAAPVEGAPSLEDFIAKAKPLNPGYSDDQIKEQYTKVYGAPQPESGNFMRGAEVGMKQLAPTMKGAVGLLGATAEEAVGTGGVATKVKNWGLNGFKEGMEKLQPLQHENDELTTVWKKVTEQGDLGALKDFVSYGLGYGASQLAQSAAVGLAGAAIGGPAGAIGGIVEQTAAKGLIASWVEKAVLKRMTQGMTKDAAVRSIGRDIGALGAMGGFSTAQEAGQIYPEAQQHANETGDPVNLARVWGASAVAGASELIPEAYIFGKALGRFTGGPSRIGRTIGGAVGGATLEAGQEAFQTGVEHYGAGEPIADEAGLKDIINSAGLALVGGGSAGMVAGAISPTPKAPSPHSVAPILDATSTDDVIAKANATVSAAPITPEGLDTFIKTQQTSGEDLIGQHLTTTDVAGQEAQHAEDRAAFADILSHAGETNEVTTDEAGNVRYQGTPIAIVSKTSLPDVTPPEGGLSKEKVDVLNTLASTMGKRVVFYEDRENLPHGVTLQSKYPNTVFMSDKTEGTDFFSVFAHEAIHLTEGTPFHQALRDVIWENRTPEQQQLAIARHGELPHDELLNELVSDVAGTELHKPAVWEKVYTNLEARHGQEEAKTQVLGFIDTLKGIIAKIQDVIRSRPWSTGFGPNKKTIAEQYVTDLTKVHDALAAGVADAIYQQKRGTPSRRAELGKFELQRQPAEAKTKATPVLGTDEEFAAYQVRTKTFRQSSLPDYAKQSILSEEATARTNKKVDVHLSDAKWEKVTIPLESLRKRNEALWTGSTFQHRGAITKGPIVVDRKGAIIDGNNRVYEAIVRGDTEISAYQPAKPAKEQAKKSELAKVDTVNSIKTTQSDTTNSSKPAEHTTPITAQSAEHTHTEPAKTATSEPAKELYDYASTQIDLAPALAQKVLALGAQVRQEDLADKGRETDPHITVLYGLHSEDPAQARAVLSGSAPVRATIGDLTFFETEDGDVLVLNVDSPQLHDLNQTLGEGLENTQDRAYNPHITVAYVKAGKGQHYVDTLRNTLRGTIVNADAITFSNKKGEKTSIPLGETTISPSVGHPVTMSRKMPAEARAFAKEYDAAPVRDQIAVPAWNALRDETNRMYADITKKVRVERVTGQPYPDAKAMNADIAKGAFKVTTDHSEHPIWSVDENVKFRVVHDYIGHFETGFDFSLEGERKAYEHHAAQLKTEDARRALKVEVYGQAAAGISNKGVFPEQKIFLPATHDVALDHYSKKSGLHEISPTFHGTGQIGAERTRMANEGAGYLARSYFYRQGTKPEARFKGLTRYTAHVPEDRLVDLASLTGTPTQREQQAKKAGYLGFYNSESSMPEAVALFEPVTVGNRLTPTFSPRQTETPEFKRWFGSSKVVNEDGSPKVVYHGTDKVFTEFSKTRQGEKFDDIRSIMNLPEEGLWFTERPTVANDYANLAHDMEKRTQNIIPAYLSMQNPYRYAAQQYADEGIGGVPPTGELRQEGYDGLIIEHGRYSDYKTATVQKEWTDYAVFEPTQIKSATGNTGEFNPRNADIRFSRRNAPSTYPITPPSTLDMVVRVLQDKNIDTKRVVEDIQTFTGAPVPEHVNPVLAEEMFQKRDEQMARDFTNDELRPLIDKMRLAKVSIKQLDDYLHARHVVNDAVNARLQAINPDLAQSPNFDKLAGITDAQAQTILNNSNRPLMDRLAKDVDDMVETTRELMVSYGLETQARIDEWRQQYQSYVPLRREGFDENGNPTGQGKSIRGSTVKQRGGSGLAVEHILANIAQTRDQIVTRGEKNRVTTAMAGLLMTYPNPALATLDKPAQITMTNPTTGLPMTVPGNLANYEVPTIRRFNPQTGAMQTYPDPMYKGRDNVVNFRVKGQDYAIVFNENNERAMEIAQAFKNLGTPQLTGIMSVIAPYTRYLAAINTQYNPIFGIVNFVRDAQYAMLTLSSTPLQGKQATVLKNAVASLYGIYQDARAVRTGGQIHSNTAQMWRRFEHVGGPTGYRDLFFSATERAEELERLMNPTSWKGTLNPQKFGKRIEETAMFKLLSDYNLMMENSIRLGVFKTAVDNGMSDLQAASYAKNITVNFNKKGQIGAQMGSLYAFFNANVQGTARIAETLFDRTPTGVRLSAIGKKIVVGGILVGVLQTFLLSMAGFDDDDPPEFVKQKNFIIPTGGKNYFMIPMPLGFNLLPNVGRLAAEVVKNGVQGKPLHVMEKIASLVGALYGGLSPVGGTGGVISEASPTVLDPFASLATNKDWTGKSIAKEDHSTLDPTPGHTRAHDTATVWAKALSKGINWATGGTDYTPGVLSPTPDQIDYLVQQATGGVGREFSKGTQMVQSALTGEEMPTHKIPLLGRFVGSATGSSAIRTRFFEHVRQANIAYNEFEGRAKAHEDFSDWLKTHPEARFSKAAITVQKDLGILQQQKQLMLKQGASRDSIALQEKRITGLMSKFNDLVEKAQHPQ